MEQRTSAETPPEQEEGADDLILTPQGLAASGPGPMEVKAWAIVHDKPTATFELPAGKKLHIYAKSEKQLERVEAAYRLWLDTQRDVERRMRRTWWHWAWRRKRVQDALDAAQAAKLRLFRAVFEDVGDRRKHQELTTDDFLSMPLALQAAIYQAHRRANDVSDLIDALFPDETAEKKTEIRRALTWSGTYV